MNFEIRRACVEDAVDCCHLDHRCFPSHVAYDLESFVELCQYAYFRFVAINNGRIIGCLFADMGPARFTGMVITVDVDPAYRRRGIGDTMMGQVEKEMLKNRVRHVYLHVYTPHQAAYHFYRRRGYIDVGLLPSYYGPGIDATLMQKKLESEP